MARASRFSAEVELRIDSIIAAGVRWIVVHCQAAQRRRAQGRVADAAIAAWGPGLGRALSDSAAKRVLPLVRPGRLRSVRQRAHAVDRRGIAKRDGQGRRLRNRCGISRLLDSQIASGQPAGMSTCRRPRRASVRPATSTACAALIVACDDFIDHHGQRLGRALRSTRRAMNVATTGMRPSSAKASARRAVGFASGSAAYQNMSGRL